MHRAVGRAVQDLHALAQRDPAAHGSWRYVWNTYSSFRAVLAYRVAHALHTGGQGNDCSERCTGAARAITETAKVQTGVEIHPAAVIGRRFVLDHAVGTVIGETAMIGDDCYVLQGVLIGARGIADNPDERRHPRLGHRVEVGGLARSPRGRAGPASSVSSPSSMPWRCTVSAWRARTRSWSRRAATGRYRFPWSRRGTACCAVRRFP
jgi:serine acetyltransferase